MESSQDAVDDTQSVPDSVRIKSDNTQKASNESTSKDKPKKGSGMLIGMILLVILTIGGIGFGAWTMMNGNDEKLNSKITTLEQQNSELEEKIIELEGGDFEEDEEYIGDEEIFYDDEEEDLDEGGYLVYSIGDCIADSGTAASPVTIIKCDATTSEGNGKFVYDSESNTLKFVLE